jgi:RHS repeat-associated protein
VSIESVQQFLVDADLRLLDGSSESWSFDYDVAGRSFHVTYPDGHVRVQLYDNEGRLNSRCYDYGSQSHCYTAAYDGAGNPQTMTDPYGGSESFQYDALNRLTQVTRTVGGQPDHVESYSYNALGALHTNYDPVAMTQVTLDDQRPQIAGSGKADSAIANTLGGQPVTLDGGGRVTALLGTTFNYDLLGFVTSTQVVNGANTVTDSFRYDSFFARNERTHTETSPATTTTTFYAYEGANLVATLTASGATTDAYLFDGVDQPLRLRRAGSSYFYEVDLAGNVRRLRDATGADLGGYRYTAFGASFGPDAQAAAPTIDQPLRWKGRWFENVAGGTYDVRARWWSPQMGAFLSIDEFAYHDRNSTLWGWPNQNPMVYADPTGHFWWILAGAAAGGALDLGAQLYGNGGNFSQVNWGEVAGWTAAGAGVGLLPEFALGIAFSGLSTSGGLTAVTSWAPQGVDATIAAGRWVMLGGATIRNWLLTGTGYPFANSQTEYVLTSELQNVPNEIGGVGGACAAATKQAIGQRIVGGP